MSGEHGGDVHARRVIPDEKRLVGLLGVVAVEEVDDLGGDFLVHGLGTFQRQRPFVLAALVLLSAIRGCTMNNRPRWRHAEPVSRIDGTGDLCEPLDRGVLTGRNNALLGRRLVYVGEAHPLHGVEVIQVAPELLEAVCRWQRRRFIAKVVLAELAGVVAEIQQEFCQRGRARQQRTGGTRKLRHDHARPQRMHAGEEGGAAGRAALLGIIGHKPRAFFPEAVDVGRLPNHEPLMVSADVHDADVVAHDEQDVGFAVSGFYWRDRPGQRCATGNNPQQKSSC